MSYQSHTVYMSTKTFFYIPNSLKISQKHCDGIDMSYSETVSSDLRPYVKLAMKDTLSDK